LHFVDQLPVELGLGVADAVAEPLLDLFSGECCNQLVAAHPDVAVDAPHLQRQGMPAEGPEPGDRVVVVRVDECSVDVQDGDFRHLGITYP
jgi:hypothetical protein